MLGDKQRAEAICKAGLDIVPSTHEPEGQKFLVGSRVRIIDHYPYNGTEATVLYTFAHAFGEGRIQDPEGSNVKSYALDLDKWGFVAWFGECQLVGTEEKVSV